MNARARRRVDPYQTRPILQPVDWTPEHPSDWQEPAQALVGEAIFLVRQEAFGDAADVYARAHEALAAHGAAADRARCLLDEGCFWHRRRDRDTPRHLERALAAYEAAWKGFSLMETAGDPGYDPLDRADTAFALATCLEDIATDTVAGDPQRHALFQRSLPWYEEALTRTASSGQAIDAVWVLLSRANFHTKLARERDWPNWDAHRVAAHGDLDRAFDLLAFSERAFLNANDEPEIVAQSIVRHHGADRSVTLAYGLGIRANLWGRGTVDEREQALDLQRRVNAIFALLPKAQERLRSGEHVLAIWYDQRGDYAQALVHAQAAVRAADALTRSALSWESLLDRRGKFITSSQLAVRLCMKMVPPDSAAAFAFAQAAKGHLARGLAQQVTAEGGDRSA